MRFFYVWEKTYSNVVWFYYLTVIIYIYILTSLMCVGVHCLGSMWRKMRLWWPMSLLIKPIIPPATEWINARIWVILMGATAWVTCLCAFPFCGWPLFLFKSVNWNRCGLCQREWGRTFSQLIIRMGLNRIDALWILLKGINHRSKGFVDLSQWDVTKT